MVNFNKIRQNLFVGSCPKTPEDIDSLLAAGVTAILNLQTDADFLVQEINWQTLLKQYEEKGIHVERLQIVDFDEEKKAAMVSNLMVVLYGDKDASPVVNTGTLHQ